MKCPACGVNTNVFRCNNCGDVSCSGNPRCPGTSGVIKSAASSGGVCRACKNGKYVKVS